LPDWTPPSKEFRQNDEHPVVNISWNEAKAFCDWLSAQTGKEWRLPKNQEWEVVVGTAVYPWGGYFPPHWDDGNYAILEDGEADPKREGVDGILGTAPVGSFKANALGFYDLGGNATEWMLDGVDERADTSVHRGSGWNGDELQSRSTMRRRLGRSYKYNACGFRLARGGV
jgi:formylglycine-generating enzyme required for sulfatase activity